MSSANHALDRHAEALRRAAACVTHARLRVVPRSAHVADIRFEPPAPLRAFGALRSSLLAVELTVEAEPDPQRSSGWKVRTRSHAYALLDRNGTEVLAFHLHTGGTFRGPDYPHLHVSAPLRFPDARGDTKLVDLDKRHLPTGPITLGRIVRMLIEELDVQPLVGDWHLRLAAAEAPPD